MHRTLDKYVKLILLLCHLTEDKLWAVVVMKRAIQCHSDGLFGGFLTHFLLSGGYNCVVAKMSHHAPNLDFSHG